DWVRDVDENDAFADSQASLDSLNGDFIIPPDGGALGIISPLGFEDMSMSAETAYELMLEFNDLFESPAPIYRYDNLPYEAYYQTINTDILPDTHLVIIQVGDNKGDVVMIFVFTTDFDRDEALVIAVMNSIALAE
ncbi:MAG TPA: hypothetical protein PLZ51_18255, partial [Aggregatilineales bacterium]|nr:hypothetical protein [Aggregatilineales bacterium]